MKNKPLPLLVIFIALLVSLLPIYPAVHEVRNISMDSNDELERELVFGSMVDFVQDFKYIQKAWDERLLPLNIFIAFINLAISLLLSWNISLGLQRLWGRLRRKK